MFVRRKHNKSGTCSIQVVAKVDGKYRVQKSFGSSRDEAVLASLEQKAKQRANEHEFGEALFAPDGAAEYDAMMSGRCISPALQQNRGPRLHLLRRLYNHAGVGAHPQDRRIQDIAGLSTLPGGEDIPNRLCQSLRQQAQVGTSPHQGTARGC